jgi:hypothetical protein
LALPVASQKGPEHSFDAKTVLGFSWKEKEKEN